MRNLFLFFILLFSFSADAQTWQWLRGFTSDPAGWSDGSAMCTDTSGNIIVAGGYIYGTGAGNYSLTGGRDYYAKYNAAGNLLWMFGGNGLGATANGACADLSGNCYFTGSFNGTVAYGAYTVSSYYEKMYLIKTDPAGNLQWLRKAQIGRSVARSVSSDNAGNVYVCGSFDSTTVIGNFTLNAAFGTNKTFLAKFDGSGNALWIKTSNGTLDDDAYAVSTDAAGNSYMTGNFWSPTISFGTYTLNNAGTSNYFLVKYDAGGNEQWARQGVGTGSFDIGMAVSCDGAGHVYLTGQFDSPTLSIGNNTLVNTNFTQWDVNTFLAKYSASGNVLWARGSKGEATLVYSASSLPAGVWIAGGIDSAAVFGAYTLNPPPGSLDAAFLVHYDSLGTINYTETFITGGDDYIGVAADRHCKVYISGDIASPTFILASDTVYLSGNETSFLAKMSYTCPAPPPPQPDYLNEESQKNSSLKIYPNPNSGIFKIESPGISKVHVYSFTGQKIAEQTLTDGKAQLNLKGIAPGYYFLRAEGENSIAAAFLIMDSP